MVLINDSSTVLQIGSTMPEFSLPATSGDSIDSAHTQSKVLVVIFTCNHCPYAKAYNQRLKTLANLYNTNDVQIVLINSNDASQYEEDSFENMKLLHAQQQFQFAYCFDETQQVAKSFGALCTPHCFVFNSQRLLQYMGRIDDNWQNESQVTDHTLKNAIDCVIHNTKIAKPTVHAIGCSIKWK